MSVVFQYRCHEQSPLVGNGSGPGEVLLCDRGQQLWLPLVPAFKQYEDHAGQDVAALTGLDAGALLDEFAATATVNEGPDPLDNWVTGLDGDLIRSRMDAYAAGPLAELIASLPADARLRDLTGFRSIIPQNLGALPASLPVLDQSATRARFSTADPSMRHRVKIYLSYWPWYLAVPQEYGGLDLFEVDYEAPLAQLSGKRITLSYAPWDREAEALIAEAGGNMYDVYPAAYLHLKPQLKIDGVVVGDHSDAISMGLSEFLWIETLAPGQGFPTNRETENVITAGDQIAIVIDNQTVPQAYVEDAVVNLQRSVTNPDATLDDLMGEHLRIAGMIYWRQMDGFNSFLSKVTKVRFTRSPSVLLVGYYTDCSYLFGFAPLEVTGANIVMDLDKDVYHPIAVDGDGARTKSWFLANGFFGALLEETVLDMMYHIQAVSVLRILETANEQAVPIYHVNRENVDELLPQLSFFDIPSGADDYTKQRLRAKDEEERALVRTYILQGWQVVVPKDPVQILDWTGNGYIAIDPATGAGSYRISGRFGGGALIQLLQDFIENYSTISSDYWLGFVDGCIGDVCPMGGEILAMSDLWGRIASGEISKENIAKEAGRMLAALAYSLLAQGGPMDIMMNCYLFDYSVPFVNVYFKFFDVAGIVESEVGSYYFPARESPEDVRMTPVEFGVLFRRSRESNPNWHYELTYTPGCIYAYRQCVGLPSNCDHLPSLIVFQEPEPTEMLQLRAVNPGCKSTMAVSIKDEHGTVQDQAQVDLHSYSATLAVYYPGSEDPVPPKYKYSEGVVTRVFAQELIAEDDDDAGYRQKWRLKIVPEVSMNLWSGATFELETLGPDQYNGLNKGRVEICQSMNPDDEPPFGKCEWNSDNTPLNIKSIVNNGGTLEVEGVKTGVVDLGLYAKPPNQNRIQVDRVRIAVVIGTPRQMDEKDEEGRWQRNLFVDPARTLWVNNASHEDFDKKYPYLFDGNNLDGSTPSSCPIQEAIEATRDSDNQRYFEQDEEKTHLNVIVASRPGELAYTGCSITLFSKMLLTGLGGKSSVPDVISGESIEYKNLAQLAGKKEERAISGATIQDVEISALGITNEIGEEEKPLGEGISFSHAKRLRLSYLYIHDTMTEKLGGAGIYIKDGEDIGIDFLWMRNNLAEGTEPGNIDVCKSNEAKLKKVGGSGGAAYLKNCHNVRISNSRLYENKGLSGGALALINSDGKIKNCKLESNKAENGGAIVAMFNDETMPWLIEGNTFDSNRVEHVNFDTGIALDAKMKNGGGGIYLYESAAEINGNRFLNNVAEGDIKNSSEEKMQSAFGGALVVDGGWHSRQQNVGIFTMLSSLYQGTLLPMDLPIGTSYDISQGGGETKVVAVACETTMFKDQYKPEMFHKDKFPVKIIDNSFHNNRTDDAGGAIVTFNESYVTSFSGNSLRENSATRDGGGIYVHMFASTPIVSNIFRNNASVKGGAIYYTCSMELGTISGNSLIGNRATSSTSSATGGGIYSRNNNMSVTSNDFVENISTVSGSALYVLNYMPIISLAPQAILEIYRDGTVCYEARKTIGIENNMFDNNKTEREASALSVTVDGEPWKAYLADRIQNIPRYNQLFIFNNKFSNNNGSTDLNNRYGAIYLGINDVDSAAGAFITLNSFLNNTYGIIYRDTSGTRCVYAISNDWYSISGPVIDGLNNCDNNPGSPAGAADRIYGDITWFPSFPF